MAGTDAITLIGVDCAADPANVGLALGAWRGAQVTLHAVRAGSDGPSVAAILAGWLAGGGPALLAIDAPLGWPAPMGAALAGHRAGERLMPRGPEDGRQEANGFFRRATDRFVRARIGLQPLDVGADRIARAAFAALWILEELRAHIGAPLALAWEPAGLGGTRAIEVYPAATLKSRQTVRRSYKAPEQRAARERILADLAPELGLACAAAPLLASAHLLDAAVCLLAGADFLAGAALAPPAELLAAARREGWIWARP